MAKIDKEKESDSFQHLKDKIENTILESRRIFLYEAVDSESAAKIIRKLWYLELQNPGKPIYLFINSPGGSVDSGFAIWDQIQMITSPVTTIVTGLAASMGSVLSLAAAPNRRFATKYARIMIHQPMIGGVIQGQATDLEIQGKEMLKTRNTLVNLYVKATGKDFETIDRALDRDMWMSADEAKEFGLLDRVITSFDEISG